MPSITVSAPTSSIDDEERLRKLVKDFLVKQDFKVVEAADGEEAVDIFLENKDIVLVILDVMMPKMDGWETCKEIRQYMNEMAVKCGFRTEFFFSDLSGEPVNYYTLEKYFRENTERIIGRPLTLHSLRHTHASLMFEGGASLEAVSLRLGHSDSRTTKDIYVHVTERLKSRYNETFDRIKILS